MQGIAYRTFACSQLLTFLANFFLFGLPFYAEPEFAIYPLCNNFVERESMHPLVILDVALVYHPPYTPRYNYIMIGLKLYLKIQVSLFIHNIDAIKQTEFPIIGLC